MKKIKNKVFIVLFTILSFFLITILFIFNITLYNNEYKSLKNKIMKIENIKPYPSIDENHPIFMDLEVYVISFDSKMNIVEVANYTHDEKSEEDIIRIAKENIGKHEIGKISNLYFNKYIFFINHKNELIIINNSFVNQILISSLKNSFIIFILLEFFVIYISILLTKWLMKPVEEAFVKQKQFIYDASHELKTPLAIIQASLETFESNPKETKWLDNIRSESIRMNKLVMDLLDLAKSEEISKNEIFTKVNLSKTVEKSILVFESLIYEQGLEINYDIEKNIIYNCNENRITQLVGILMDNAIKHAFEKSKITVQLFKEKDNIILKVTNRGKAIPKEQQNKIFERFYRVDESRNRNENRYGLGLAIAKNIVINHNGKINVSCEHGYTTFKVSFK